MAHLILAWKSEQVIINKKKDKILSFYRVKVKDS